MPFPSIFQDKPKFARLVTSQNVFHLLRKNKNGNWLEKFCNCVLSFWPTIQKILLNYKFSKIFTFERKNFVFLLLLQANIPYNYSSWIGVIESFKKWLSSTKSKIVPFHSLRDLVKTCVDNASCIFGNGHQCKRIEDFNAFIKVKRKRHNFEEPFAIEKVALFEKRELSCICLK